jgi:hypothetical protein
MDIPINGGSDGEWQLRDACSVGGSVDQQPSILNQGFKFYKRQRTTVCGQLAVMG